MFRNLIGILLLYSSLGSSPVRANLHDHVYSFFLFMAILDTETLLERRVVGDRTLRNRNLQKVAREFEGTLRDLDRPITLLRGVIPDFMIADAYDIPIEVIPFLSDREQRSLVWPSNDKLTSMLYAYFQRFIDTIPQEDMDLFVGELVRLRDVSTSALFRGKPLSAIQNIFGPLVARDFARSNGFSRGVRSGRHPLGEDVLATMNRAIDRRFSKLGELTDAIEAVLEPEDRETSSWNEYRFSGHSRAMISLFMLSDYTRKDRRSYVQMERVRRNFLEYQMQKSPHYIFHLIQESIRIFYLQFWGRAYVSLSISPTLIGSWQGLLRHDKRNVAAHSLEMLYSYPRSRLLYDSEEAFEQHLDIIETQMLAGLIDGVDISGSIAEADFSDLNEEESAIYQRRLLRIIGAMFRSKRNPVLQLHMFEGSNSGSFYEAVYATLDKLSELALKAAPPFHDQENFLQLRFGHIAKMSEGDIENLSRLANKLLQMNVAYTIFEANISSNLINQDVEIEQLAKVINRLIDKGQLVVLGGDGAGMMYPEFNLVGEIRKLWKGGLSSANALFLMYLNAVVGPIADSGSVPDFETRDELLAKFAKDPVRTFFDITNSLSSLDYRPAFGGAPRESRMLTYRDAADLILNDLVNDLLGVNIGKGVNKCFDFAIANTMSRHPEYLKGTVTGSWGAMTSVGQGSILRDKLETEIRNNMRR